MNRMVREICGAFLLTAWGLYIGWALEDIRHGKMAESITTILKALVFAWLLLSVVLA